MSSRYHMGCGTLHLEGYLNVDLVETPATDVVADLTDPQLPEPGDVFFSHAFFEHLRRDARIPHLRAIRENATEDGIACYLGLPDFARVAQLYLEHGPGVVGPTFDLYNVYRYTHGDPEMNPEAGWEPQLHKSLFDVQEVGRLLRDAGWPSYVVFRYVFREGPPLDLNLGFFASAQRRSPDELRAGCLAFLAQFEDRFALLDTVRFESERSVPTAVARATAGPQRRVVKRAAYALAAALARHTHPA